MVHVSFHNNVSIVVLVRSKQTNDE